MDFPSWKIWYILLCRILDMHPQKLLGVLLYTAGIVASAGLRPPSIVWATGLIVLPSVAFLRKFQLRLSAALSNGLMQIWKRLSHLWDTHLSIWSVFRKNVIWKRHPGATCYRYRNSWNRLRNPKALCDQTVSGSILIRFTMMLQLCPCLKELSIYLRQVVGGS